MLRPFALTACVPARTRCAPWSPCPRGRCPLQGRAPGRRALTVPSPSPLPERLCPDNVDSKLFLKFNFLFPAVWGLSTWETGRKHGWTPLAVKAPHGPGQRLRRSKHCPSSSAPRTPTARGLHPGLAQPPCSTPTLWTRVQSSHLGAVGACTARHRAAVSRRASPRHSDSVRPSLRRSWALAALVSACSDAFSGRTLRGGLEERCLCPTIPWDLVSHAVTELKVLLRRRTSRPH